MKDKEIVKYIDLVIKDIEDFNAFSINNVVFKYLKPESKAEKESFLKLVDEIKLFGKNNDLFVLLNKGDFFKLTEKGKQLKLSNKTFKNFHKSENKTHWYNNNWVGYVIATIVFLFTIYQHFDNTSLKK